MSNVRAGVGIGVLLGLTLSALLMLMATAPSQAQTAGDCQGFDVLRAHLEDPEHNTEAVTITGGKSDKERAGLLKLVDDAEALASIGKTSDAVKKLSDFTVKVDQLETAGRISTESAGLLRSDAQATIGCLQRSDTTTAG